MTMPNVDRSRARPTPPHPSAAALAQPALSAGNLVAAIAIGALGVTLVTLSLNHLAYGKSPVGPDPRSSERDRLGRPGCVLLRADAENLWRRRAEEIGAGWKTGSGDGGAGGRSQLRRHLRLVISLPVSSSVSAKINVADGEGRGASARRGPARKATALARSNRRMGQDTLSAFCAVIHTKAAPAVDCLNR